MSPVPSEELKVLGLSNSPQHTEWVGVLVDVPKHVAVLDFVFSDAKEEMWDNNNGQDFHTAIENPLSNDELVVAAFEAMRAETAANDKDLEDRIGKAAARKLEVKVNKTLSIHICLVSAWVTWHRGTLLFYLFMPQKYLSACRSIKAFLAVLV